MQLFSIENLSLAAEVTVVLLLLAFAWPQKTIEPVQEVSVEKSVGWEPAKFYFLRFCMLRGLYLKQFRLSQRFGPSPTGTTEPYAPEQHHDVDRPSVPTPWQDRLTHLLNRHGFDALLKEWMAIAPNHRGDSCMSMVTVSCYADLVTTHGAMVTEQAIQRIASQLEQSLSTEAIISKYLPDRFVILHFASQLSDCHGSLAAAQQIISEDGFFKAAGEPLSLPCAMSIVALGAEAIVNTKIDELDEGIVESQQSGRSILARVDDSWIESPPATAPVECTVKPESSGPQIEADSNQLGLLDSTETKERTSEQPPAKSSAKTNGDLFENNDSSAASNDISAVASADDIALLLAQINTNKANKSETQKQLDQNPVAATQAGTAATTPTPVNSEAAKVAIDESEAASADDIAALFASMKPNAATAPVATGTTTAPPAPPVSKPANENLEIDVTEAATADDIAALFATMKPNATNASVSGTIPSGATSAPTEKKQTTAPKSVPAEPTPAAISPAPPVTAEELGEVATADDIAALFATVKSAVKPTPPAPAVKPTPSVETETPPPIPTGEELGEAATADDIAMLFQSVKPNAVQPHVAAAQTIEPTPVASTATTTPASAVQAEVDLSSNASADDIAALFASMRK